ncbi:chemotaxis protein CheD [Aestuariicoccus sp. MJ-SS9]|uniref:chemotaxis protein CheD n=1 Tax=Aestuariicoccus sp. MJ-SS9 TaxID=3079855 RepID=UPI002908820B|nr:chemotaxis protein CheD [Aestuariicoccus sp. MJ-SS9]MDU8912387.1 chemotaxis protein CheD [Aestuariicoccus sp. MJ-SS9]
MTLPDQKTVTVIQGEYAIADAPNVVLSTVLGSCVAVCLNDPAAKIGGMNHFLLPERTESGRGDVRFGAYLMELLINDLLKHGARKDRMVAKLFGGARMNVNLRDIGASNAAFARRFLADEGIPCVAESLGGTSARRLRFWPRAARAQQFLVPDTVEPEVPPRPAPRAADAGITLF